MVFPCALTDCSVDALIVSNGGYELTGRSMEVLPASDGGALTVCSVYLLIAPAAVELTGGIMNVLEASSGDTKTFPSVDVLVESCALNGCSAGVASIGDALTGPKMDVVLASTGDALTGCRMHVLLASTGDALTGCCVAVLHDSTDATLDSKKYVSADSSN